MVGYPMKETDMVQVRDKPEFQEPWKVMVCGKKVEAVDMDLLANSLPVDSVKATVRLPLPIYTVVPVVGQVIGWVQVQVAERSRSRHMVMEMSPSKVV